MYCCLSWFVIIDCFLLLISKFQVIFGSIYIFSFDFPFYRYVANVAILDSLREKPQVQLEQILKND